jgi:hypothetical protein
VSERLLTLSEAQREINMRGSRGRKLQRYLLAKERERRRQIMVRLPGNHRIHYRVTMALLRRWCPELFPDSAVDKLRKQLPELVRLIDHRAHRVFDVRFERDVTPRIKELWERDESLAKSVDRVTVSLVRRKPA